MVDCGRAALRECGINGMERGVSAGKSGVSAAKKVRGGQGLHSGLRSCPTTGDDVDDIEMPMKTEAAVTRLAGHFVLSTATLLNNAESIWLSALSGRETNLAHEACS